MQTQTARLWLPDELHGSGSVGLPDGDLAALRAVADWIKVFVVNPHPDLGRPGPVCPFVPEALARGTLWLAPERIADRTLPEVVEVIREYKDLFLNTAPVVGDDASYKVIVVVFTDLEADRSPGVFGDVLEELAGPSYVGDGIVFGPFYQGNKGSAIYNPSFHPFQSPAPFLFVRQGVVSDWKFNLNDQVWLTHWADRFGASAVHALAAELRRLPWNARRG